MFFLVVADLADGVVTIPSLTGPYCTSTEQSLLNACDSVIVIPPDRLSAPTHLTRIAPPPALALRPLGSAVALVGD